MFVALQAGFPARGDFGLAASSSQLWVAGGRHVNSLSYGDSQLFNDVWSSEDGSVWELNTTAAPWEPRCMHMMEYNENQLVIFGGMTRLPDPPPPPVKTPAEKALDAALNAPTERTVDAGDNVITSDSGETIKFELINNLRLVMSEEVWAWNTVIGGGMWVICCLGCCFVAHIGGLAAQWTQDFANHTDTMYYVRPESRLWGLKYLDLNTRLALESVGYNTLGDILDTTADKVCMAFIARALVRQRLPPSNVGRACCVLRLPKRWTWCRSSVTSLPTCRRSWSGAR